MSSGTRSAAPVAGLAALLPERGQEPSGGGLRRSVATLQIALCVVTGVGAGLLVRSMNELRSLEVGFEPEGLSVVSLTHDYAPFRAPASYNAALEEVSRDLQGTAGVLGASPTVNPPLSVNGGLDVVLRQPTARPRFAAGVLLAFAGMTLGLALAAGALPAIRATRADPLVSLKAE